MRLQLFGERLQKLFDQQVAEKAGTEERFLEDLRQYNGEYDAEVLSKIRQAGAARRCSTSPGLSATLSSRGWASSSCRRTTATSRRSPPHPRVHDRHARPQHCEGRRWAADAQGRWHSLHEGRSDVGHPGASKGRRRAHGRRDGRPTGRVQLQRGATQCDPQHGGLRHGHPERPVLRNRVQKKYSRTRVPDPVTGLAVEQWQMQVFEDLAPGAESVSPGTSSRTCVPRAWRKPSSSSSGIATTALSCGTWRNCPTCWWTRSTSCSRRSLVAR